MRRRVLEEGRHRCGYCLTPAAITGTPMELDHLVPGALGGPTVDENLWPACSRCNVIKGNRIAGPDPQSGEKSAFFNPRRQAWSDHFEWSDSGVLIVGKTSIGRATVAALRLNRPVLAEARSAWVAVGWHPPDE